MSGLVLLFSIYLLVLSSDLQTFLQDQIEFSKDDLQKLGQGMVLTKLLDTGKKPEVAVFSIMHMDVPADFFVEKYRDIETSMKSKEVMEIRKFDDPPQLGNLSAFKLEPDELTAIKECEVGNCDMKLPASVIERLRQEVDWSKPDYQERVTELVKQMLLDYVNSYLNGGSAAMGQYDDQKYPLRQADEFHELLQESNYLYEYVPELYKYLEVYPKGKLEDVENFICWSLRKYERLRPIVSLNHVTIFKRSQGKVQTWIASKQIYANHYFEASLELTALMEEPNKPGFFLLYLSRSRFDTLRKKTLPGMERTIRKEMLSKVDQEMNSTKTKMETLYQDENFPSREIK